MLKELQYLNKYFIKYKYRFLLGIFITIITQIFSLFTPELVGDTIRAVEEHFKYQKTTFDEVQAELLKNILWIIGATLVAGFLTFLMRQTLIVMSRHIEFDLKNEIYNHYQVLSQNFYKQNRTGDLMNRISEDVGKVRMYVGPAVMYTLNTLMRFVIVIVYMYNVSPKLTLYSLFPLPVLAYSIFRVSQNINKKSSIYQQNLSKLSTFAQEIFSGIRVVKAYTLEPQKQAEYEVLSAESKQKYMNLSTTSALFGPLMILLIGLSNLIVIYVGGNMYMEGKIADIGIIAQFILYINMLTWPVASLGWVSSMVQEAEASQKRINEFLKTEPEIKNHNPKETKIEGKIEFKNVSFTYLDTNIEALKNLSFTLEKGKTLGIVGNTGSGKSTLATLISRLYDLDSGEILIDDIPIKKLNLNNLRDAIAVVPQDAFLFSDTIKNNIKFGKATATDDEVIEVAKKAVIHDNIIGFTHQYETILGERGITLSGGQKQRVSIARALLKEAPILVLDDCLSAVDTETEEKILQNLWQHTQQKTTLIISHRISSVKNADAILVLENGTIIQQGTHNQLIAQEGYYKNLYLKQLAEG